MSGPTETKPSPVSPDAVGGENGLTSVFPDDASFSASIEQAPKKTPYELSVGKTSDAGTIQTEIECAENVSERDDAWTLFKVGEIVLLRYGDGKDYRYGKIELVRDQSFGNSGMPHLKQLFVLNRWIPCTSKRLRRVANVDADNIELNMVAEGHNSPERSPRRDNEELIVIDEINILHDLKQQVDSLKATKGNTSAEHEENIDIGTSYSTLIQHWGEVLKPLLNQRIKNISSKLDDLKGEEASDIVTRLRHKAEIMDLEASRLQMLNHLQRENRMLQSEIKAAQILGFVPKGNPELASIRDSV